MLAELEIGSELRFVFAKTRKDGAPKFRLMQRLERQALEVLAKLFAELGTLESELNCGLQHAEFVSGVEALAFEGVAEYLLFLQQSLDAVRQLDFATCAGSRLLKQFEDARG